MKSKDLKVGTYFCGSVYSEYDAEPVKFIGVITTESKILPRFKLIAIIGDQNSPLIKFLSKRIGSCYYINPEKHPELKVISREEAVAFEI